MNVLFRINCIVLLLITTNLMAQEVPEELGSQILIPTTASDRKDLAAQLQQKYTLEKKIETLKELAVLNAVITIEDKNTLQDVESAEKLIEKCETLLPNDAELLAIHGSLLTVKSKYFLNDTSRALVSTKKGLMMMDQAVNKQPKNLTVLFWRGVSILHLPSFLGRQRTAIEDFKKINELTGMHFGSEYAAMIHYYLGCAYQINQQEQEAKLEWKKAADLKSGYWSERALKSS